MTGGHFACRRTHKMEDWTCFPLIEPHRVASVQPSVTQVTIPEAATILPFAASVQPNIAEQLLAKLATIEENTRRQAAAFEDIAASLQRLAEVHAPVPSEKVDSVYVADRLGYTTTWVADMARNGEIPAACIVPGTGNGKPWKFYRERIERWMEKR